MSVRIDGVTLDEVVQELGKIPGMLDLIAAERAVLDATEIAKAPSSDLSSLTKHNDDGELTIGERAAEYGVSLRILRFYEDRRLLRPRREGTMRIYSGADRLRLQMIIKGRQLGVTLTEIADLIGTQDSADSFEEKLRPAQIMTQIDHLERQRREIDDAIMRLEATHDRVANLSEGHERRAGTKGKREDPN